MTEDVEVITGQLREGLKEYKALPEMPAPAGLMLRCRQQAVKGAAEAFRTAVSELGAELEARRLSTESAVQGSPEGSKGTD